VLRASRPGFTPAQLLDATAATLYVVAPERHQRLLAPLNVAILSSLFAELAIRTNAGRRPDPTLRVLLDEAANIAPLARLPQHISEAGGNGARIATVWQSVAQIRARYAHDADTILAGSTAKVFMGPITDQATRQEVTGLLGDQLVHTESTTEGDGRRSRTHGRQWRPRGAPDALQQFGGDRGLFVNGPLPPAVVRLTPWDRQRHLRGARKARESAVPPRGNMARRQVTA
jgi:type IV secretion system protein VirD4